MNKINELEQTLLFVRVELDKLRDEIYELKKCQIDFIKLSTIIFGLVASAIAALTPHLPIFDQHLKPVNAILYLCILSIIGFAHPYIMWVIIHKCRSIFRIVAYIRILEELATKGGEKSFHFYHGYETLHRILKKHPWLSIRVFSFDRLFIRVLRDIRSYKHWIDMIDEKFPQQTLVSIDGIKEKGIYIGDYYGKLLFFTKLLWFMGCIGLVVLSFYGVYRSQGLWSWFFGGVGIFFILWAAYHLLLTKRYLLELRYRPFSIDAHYDMWKWALDQLESIQKESPTNHFS